MCSETGIWGGRQCLPPTASAVCPSLPSHACRCSASRAPGRCVHAQMARDEQRHSLPQIGSFPKAGFKKWASVWRAADFDGMGGILPCFGGFSGIWVGKAVSITDTWGRGWGHF